jgi:ABC-type glutathione transport system ATPase component
MTIGRTLEESIAIHAPPRRSADPACGDPQASCLSTDVLENFRIRLGGQARRVGVAGHSGRAPRFIVADELTAGLDVSGAGRLPQPPAAQIRTHPLLVSHNLNDTPSPAGRR